MALRCKMTGCDLDACGVCRRCGSEAKANHNWQETEPERPCFKRKVCQTCNQEHEMPEHDWEASEGGPDGIQMKCSRCGSPMVLRTARKGMNTGGQFWGCSEYPKCRNTVSA